MSKNLDFLFLGGGSVVHFIANLLVKKNFKVIVVSNFIPKSALYGMATYEELLYGQRHYEVNLVILTTRKSVTNPDLIDEVLRYLYMKTIAFSKLIYFSSSAVYGESLEVNIEDSILNGFSEYAQEKVCIESRLNRLDCDFVILRIANLYGSIEFKGFVSDAIKDFIKTGYVHIPKKSVYRNFVHAIDLMKLLEYLIANEVPNGIYNFASQNSISLEKVANLITGPKLNHLRVIKDIESPGIIHSKLSNAKLSEVYPFPLIEIEEGIEAMLRDIYV